MKPSWRFGATCLMLGSTLLASRAAMERRPGRLAQPLTSISTRIGGWSGTDDPPLAERIAGSLSATSYLSRTYRRDGRSIGFFVAFYASQRAGESMHSPKYCLPGGGWEMTGAGRATIQTGGRSVEINDYLLLQPGERARMLYWYQNKSRVIASEYAGKLYLVLDALRLGRTSGAIVRITTADDPASVAAAYQFASEAIPQVSRCFAE
jgi:EpsI family protein